MAYTHDKLREIGSSIKRIRIAESRDEDGRKQVWHRADGADLLSRVNWLGRAYYQELTFDHLIVTWTVEDGISTGREDVADRAVGRRASTVVKKDPRPQLATLGDALVLAKAAAQDRYFAHLAAEIEKALTASMKSQTGDGSDHEVTAMPDQKTPEPAAPPEGFLAGLVRRMKGIFG